jgi:hypothetical protein
MRYLQKILRNLDLIVAVFGIITLLALIPILLLQNIHRIYLVAITIGIICISVYLLYGKKLIVKTWGIKNSWAILLVICIVGLSQLWIVNLQFPNSLIGLDPWTHMRATTQELEIALNPAPNTYDIGHLNWSTIGGYFSLMHLYLKSMMDIFGLNYKWTSLIFWGSLQTIGTIVFVYLNGKGLVNKSVGLLAAFLVSIASWVVYFSEWCIPNGIGATLSLIVAYLFIKSYKTNKHWLAWLSLIFIPIAVFTHILVVVWIVGTMLCMCLIPILLDCIEAFRSWKQRIKLHHILLPIIAILSLVCWYKFSTVTNATYEVSVNIDSMPSFGQNQTTVQELNQSLNTVLSNAIESPVTIPQQEIEPIVHDALNNGNIVESVIDGLGMFLYIGIGIIGILMMLRFYPNMNKTWAILCIGTLIIGFLPSLFGFTILKERWWYLTEVFMSIPLAVALIGIYNK